MRESKTQKNYRYFVNQTEKAFYEQKYLEAFLIQSCIIEGVLKEYASIKLSQIVERSPLLKQKYKNFEFARLIDELFITGNISKDLYENLSQYKKKRNNIVHRILKQDDKKLLDKELKEAYELGRYMKGFIVDDLLKSRKGRTLAELAARQEAILSEVTAELPKALAREFTPMLKKLNRDLSKLAKKR